jgi:hypothetical protein
MHENREVVRRVEVIRDVYLIRIRMYLLYQALDAPESYLLHTTVALVKLIMVIVYLRREVSRGLMTQ